MGIDAADFDNSGAAGIAITNFDNEMVGLYRLVSGGAYTDVAMTTRVSGRRRATVWALAARLSMPTWTAGSTCSR